MRSALSIQSKSYHHGNLAEAILARAAEVIDQEGIDALSLRGIARDLGVSHGAPNRHFKNKAALLSALAADGWDKARNAALGAAEATQSDNPHVRLNAMGKGFLAWALAHRALFRAIYHPDVSRQASEALREANRAFSKVIRAAVEATQRDGRHPKVELTALTLFTNAVPTGAALMLLDSVIGEETMKEMDTKAVVDQVIDLVVPIPR